MRETEEITNSEDVIDSRAVIARIAYLESEWDTYKENHTLSTEDLADPALAVEDRPAPWEEEYPEDAHELAALKKLAEECEGYGDWKYGESLIRDSYFEDYARQLAEDLGAISKDATWPNNYIDWPRAAEALQMDYSSVDFDGVTYWVRV